MRLIIVLLVSGFPFFVYAVNLLLDRAALRTLIPDIIPILSFVIGLGVDDFDHVLRRVL